MPEIDVINFEVLYAAGLINERTRQVKVFASGEVTEKLNLQGINVSKGAKAAIEAAGGTVNQEVSA